MKLGEVANPGAAPYGKPLDGVRILAAEQMQSLPYATQLLGRLGAEVVKVEHPVRGESGRSSSPTMVDPNGREVGATFLRNNFGKRSVGIDLKTAAGRDLFLSLVPHFDVVAENFKAGTMERLGLGYDHISAEHPGVIYLSISGFGNRGGSPYSDWPAYASIVEAMAGIYEYRVPPNGVPQPGAAGALGDISSALFGVIGVLAALRHRDATGRGQYVDIAMLDAMLAMADVVTSLHSFGLTGFPPVICEAFTAADGYVVVQVGREPQFEALADLVGRPNWKQDPKFATREGWLKYLESEIRPAVEAWTGQFDKREAAQRLQAVGIAAGPSNTAAEVVADPHVAARNMIVEMDRTDNVGAPLLTPGNPVKLSMMSEGPETRVPWVAEHTDQILHDELGFGAEELARWRKLGAIA
jgi:formyl-CoA transferase